MAAKSNGKRRKSASNSSFRGWRRENGRVGVRNHVVILPLDDLSNAASEAVANNIKGTLALPHSYGRLQFGADLDLHFRTLIGTGSNPNVAAVVVRSQVPANAPALNTKSPAIKSMARKNFDAFTLLLPSLDFCGGRSVLGSAHHGHEHECDQSAISSA